MMLDINLVRLREGFWRWFPFGAGIAGVMVFEMIYVLGARQTSDTVHAVVHPANYSNTKELGRLLYTDYVYPFELAAVLLLLAMVAAIALTLRRRVGVKSQKVSEQVQVKASDRVRIVKQMSAEGTNSAAK
jgi:NADH-quinone oxidoreductase subunit J